MVVKLSLEEERSLKTFLKEGTKKIVWSYGKGVVGEWRKLHCKELHNYCSSVNIVLVKFQAARFAGRVAL
jgi:uncharacterized protein affecting Mg2+/Co2+ transport